MRAIRIGTLAILLLVCRAGATVVGPGGQEAHGAGITLDLGGGQTMELVVVRGGTFTMGSPADEPGRADDEQPHRVTLDRGFAIGRTAVTRGQWERFVAETGFRSEAETGTSGGWGWNGTALEQRKEFTWRTPGFAQDGSHPVCLVTFADAEAFCTWLSRRSGLAVTLPTEAQWEYACRAGTTGAWHGPEPVGRGAGAPTADGAPIAWHRANAGDGSRPAAAALANPWGLHVGGNVAEWCRDWYGPYPTDAVTDPCRLEPPAGEKPRRIVRGGSWNRDPKNTRSAARFRLDPRSRNADVGFRVVIDTTVEAADPAAVARPAPAGAIPNATRSVDPPPAVTPPPVSPPADGPDPWHAPGGAAPIADPFGSWSFIWWAAWLAVPLVAVTALLRRLLGGGSARAPRPGGGRHAPLGASRTDVAIDIRADGFWVRGSWPPGTTLAVSYAVAGRSVEDRLIYRPAVPGSRGAPHGGQFIFTGSRPSLVRVTPVPDDGSTAAFPPAEPEPPMEGPWRRGPTDETATDTATARRRPPPRRPTAY